MGDSKSGGFWLKSHNKPSEQYLLVLLDKALYITFVHLLSLGYEFWHVKEVNRRLRVGYTKLRHTKSIKLL